MTTEADVRKDARLEAAPIALLATLMLCALAAVSAERGWSLVGEHDVWIAWAVLAVPMAVLSVVLLVGLGAGGSAERRRRLAEGLVASVVVGSLVGLGLLVVTLLERDGSASPGQLLATAFVLLLTSAAAFGLALWELDSGGPVRRRLAGRPTPDLMFPQDETPSLARPGWTPHAWDYFYVSLTNSIAFSPTDTMPLTLAAKGLMGLQSVASAVTLLIVAARAVNIL